MNRHPPPRDRAWLERLFDAHHAQLLAFAVRRIGPDEADDVVSEVFATAWRRRLDVPDEPLPWLYQVARHVVLHGRRSFSRRATLVDAAAHVTLSTSASLEESSRALVDSVLDALDPTDAEVLRLTIWEQLTPAEIAHVVGITPGAARTRLMRARQRAQALYTRSLTPIT